MPPAHREPSWRDLVPAERRTAASTPLALGVDLRQLTTRGTSPWMPRRSTAATPAGLRRDARDLSVGLRPLERSRTTANWVKGQVSWDLLRRPGGPYDPRHARWFAELHSIAREIRTAGPYVASAEWLTLDTVESGLVWWHLAGAAALGIPLVAARKQLSVTLATDASLSLTLTRLGEAVSVAARIEIDGADVDAMTVRPVARSGVYAFDAPGDRIALTLAPLPLSEPSRALLAAHTPIVVPGADVGDFLREGYPRLARHDRIEVVGTLELPPLPAVVVEEVGAGELDPALELTSVPQITVSTVESTDPDWFELGVIVTIDGRRIPFTPLFTALALRRKRMMLADGHYFSLAHPALDRLRELIDEAGDLDEWEAGLRISRHQTALWADFEDLADQSEPAVSWRAVAEGLRDVDRVDPTPLPAALTATLRPYQRAGFDWLAFLWRHRLGGILADDMGLGKTLQILALIAHARESGEQRPFLVVAPTSVLSTWGAEAERFLPGLDVAVVDATRAKRGATVADAAATADLVVTSYTLVRLDEKEFGTVEWAGLVLDEAQFVKNAQTRLHRVVRDLRRDVTIAVTGTPLENSLTELWALLSLTAPGLFASGRRFREEYVQPIEKGKVPENAEGAPYRAARLDRLRRRIRPLVLRRTKESVAADLPPKQEQSLQLELAPAHRALYDTVLQRERQKVLGLLPDLDRNRFIVFRSLTLLRLLSLAPELVDPAHAHVPSSKLDALLEQLEEIVAEGHRALIFSQFTSFLELASRRLDAAGIRYAYLDGSTRRRAAVIDEFRSGDAPVFLISLKAGGFGLTLTEADYVFLLDPWWNPAAEAQAVDRTHRIGQRRTVMVYRMIAAGTIEEKVMALQRRKARLFTAVMDDDALLGQALTADDIRGLLDG